MARIAGVDLPRTKRVEIGLTYIYGIGRKRSNDVLGAAGVSPDIRVKDLSEEDVRKISRVLEDVGGIEGDLRKEISLNIKRLMEIGCYRGLRHRRKDRKSTRLNSSHLVISYAVFCLKKKNEETLKCTV